MQPQTYVAAHGRLFTRGFFLNGNFLGRPGPIHAWGIRSGKDSRFYRLKIDTGAPVCMYPALVPYLPKYIFCWFAIYSTSTGVFLSRNFKTIALAADHYRLMNDFNTLVDKIV
jgi:hypothetical protein